MIRELTTNLEAIGQFGAYGGVNPTIAQACNQTFRSVLDFDYYDNGNASTIKVSIQSALMDYTIQLSKLSMATIDSSVLNSPIVMNPLVNTEMISHSISFSIEAILSYLKEIKSNIDKMTLIIMIVLFVFFAIFYIFLTIVEISKVKSNKNEVYSCFTSFFLSFYF